MPTALARSCCCLLAILTVAATPLAAQTTSSASTSSGRTPYPAPPYYGYGGMGYGGGGYGWGWGTTGGIGSTAAGSYLGGLGMAIRAKGQYNLMTSQAAVNLAEARKREMQNQVEWTNTYFEKRRINQAARAAERGPKLSEKDWVQMAQNAAPKRLESDALDPVTGQINWPPALRAEIFAEDRETLDQLFTQRAQVDGAIGMQAYSQIRGAVNDALAKLKSHIRNIDTQRYLQARTFLTGLAREADFPSS